ncbi:MAG: branched-chain amino acid ABC transporter permease [Methylobacteriaceae bacterium]|nr:branched-chain amino acid ABC transporter permease [Methylobacteriaceae bacterium]
MSLRGFGLLLLLAAALSGCAELIDPQELRLCRMIAPALAPAGARVVVIRQSGGVGLVAAEQGRRRARIDYRLSPPPRGPSRPLFVECRFAERGAGGGSPDLTAVTTQDGPFAAARLYFLKRFWLDTPEAQLADPGFAAAAEAAPGLPFGLAYGLQHGLAALPLMAVYALLASAYALVYGLVGRINLAFGELAATGGYAALFGFVIAAGHAPAVTLTLAAGLAAWAALAHGAATARFVFEPLRRATGQQALVATVGLSLALQEYLRLTQGARRLWVGPILAEPFVVARSGEFIVTATPIALILAGLALAAGGGVLAALKFMRFGRDWRAAADDAATAQLFGVSPTAIFFKTFALASALAGLAGFILTAHHGSLGYAASTTLGLKALIAAILGGVGSAPGAFLGGLAIGAGEALWSAVFPIVWRDAAVYAVLAIVLVFRPGGLFGDAEGRPRRP